MLVDQSHTELSLQHLGITSVKERKITFRQKQVLSAAENTLVFMKRSTEVPCCSEQSNLKKQQKTVCVCVFNLFVTKYIDHLNIDVINIDRKK